MGGSALPFKIKLYVDVWTSGYLAERLVKVRVRVRLGPECVYKVFLYLK